MNGLPRWIAAMRAVIGGATWGEAGAGIGVSAGRCKEGVRKVMRMSLHPKLLSGPIPHHDGFDVREARKQREFWLAQADVMAKEWSVYFTDSDRLHRRRRPAAEP